jgi:hypothetical protein
MIMNLQPHQERVVKEHRKLDKKLNKLRDFIASQQFSQVDIDEQQRLIRQAAAMQEYACILMERVDHF